MRGVRIILSTLAAVGGATPPDTDSGGPVFKDEEGLITTEAGEVQVDAPYTDCMEASNFIGDKMADAAKVSEGAAVPQSTWRCTGP